MRLALNSKTAPNLVAKSESDNAATDTKNDDETAGPDSGEDKKPPETGGAPTTNVMPKIAKMWEVSPDQKFVLPPNLSLSMPADMAVVPGIKPLTAEQINELRKLLSQHNLQHMQGLTREQLKKLLEARKNAERPRSDQNATNPSTEVASEPDELLRPKRPARPRLASTPEDRPTLPPGLTSPFKYKPWSPAWRERYALLVRPTPVDNALPDSAHAPQTQTADTQPPVQTQPNSPNQTGENQTGTSQPRIASLGTGQNRSEQPNPTQPNTPLPVPGSNAPGKQPPPTGAPAANTPSANTVEPRSTTPDGNTGRATPPNSPDAERPGAVLGTGQAANAATNPQAGTAQGTTSPTPTSATGTGAAAIENARQPKTGDGQNGRPTTARPAQNDTTGLLGTGTAPPVQPGTNTSTPPTGAGAPKPGSTPAGTGQTNVGQTGPQNAGNNQPATNVLGTGQTPAQTGAGQTGTASPATGTGQQAPTAPGTGLLGTGANQANQTGTGQPTIGQGAGKTTLGQGTGQATTGQTITGQNAVGVLGTGTAGNNNQGVIPPGTDAQGTGTAQSGTGLLGAGQVEATQPGTTRAGTGLLGTGAGQVGATPTGTAPTGTGLLGTGQAGTPPGGTGLLGTGQGAAGQTGTAPRGSSPAGTGVLGAGTAPAGAGVLGTGAAPAGDPPTGEAAAGGDFGTPDQGDMGGEAFVDSEGIAGEEGESQDAINGAAEEFTPAEGVNPNMPPHNHDQQKGIPGALVLPPLPPLGSESGTESTPRTPKPLTRLALAEMRRFRPLPMGAPASTSAPRPRKRLLAMASQTGGERPRRFVPQQTVPKPAGASASMKPAVISPSFGSTSTRGTILLPSNQHPLALGTVPGNAEPQPVALTPAGVAKPTQARISTPKPAQRKSGIEGRSTQAKVGDKGLPTQPALAKPAIASAEWHDDAEAPEIAARQPVKNSQGIKEGGKNPLPPTPLPDSDAEIGDGSGLKGEYYLGRNFDQYQFTRADPNVDFVWATDTNPSPNPRLPQGSDYSARWTGKIQPRHSETYTIYAVADDGVRVWVDHKLLIDAWAIHGVLEYQGKIELKADHQYDIRVDYFEANAGGAAIGVYWESPSQTKEFIPEDRLFYPLAGDKASLELDEKPRTY